ncbi:helix-turn-helix domain-containing protein [Erwinia sp. P6884]|uniref:helix-turn-helix domain-containing protein n=1 Tax=Erwinia sp. P6884 TaxID=3141450 RepID=UPI00319BA98D
MKELDIAQVAQLAKIAPSALRFYEKKGLIQPTGRNGLRRQYGPEVLNQLALIALGQTAGFTLDDIAEMFDARGRVTLDPERLLSRAQEIDETIRQLKKVSQGLKHVAGCTAPSHMQCPQFLKILGRAKVTASDNTP